MNLQMECFNFEMFCLESEQSINATLFSENAEMFSLNESENTGNVISRIFDSIAMFIDKIIQQAKKKMATIGFKSAKEKIEKIRQSTKEITSNDEVELKFNDSKYLKKNIISYRSLENLTGITECSSTGIQFSNDHNFVNQFRENKSIDAKKYAMDTFCDDMNLDKNDSKSIQDIINNKNKVEKVKAKDIKEKISLVEIQLADLDDFISKDFKSCLDELIKVRNDMRKKSKALKAASVNFRVNGIQLSLTGFNKQNASKLASSAASAYNTYVHTMTSYLFATIRTQIGCFKHNVKVLSGILL